MIKNLFKANTWLDVVKHIAIAIVLFAIVLMVIFYLYLPKKTKQGQTITVPDVTEMEYEALEDFITSRELRFEVVADSGYNADLPPRAVIAQYPKPDSKVKEGRKIYLTLNAVNPPKVEMPDLVGKSLKTVQLQFKAMGVREGRRIFDDGPFKNTFISAQIDGVDIRPGDKITKGSVVDLVLQNGKGQQYFSAPDVIGKDRESAEFIIAGNSLNLGEIHYEVADTLQGLVVRQRPEGGSRVRVGQTVELWVNVKDSLATGNSILDLNND